MMFISLARQRRSVRKFRDEPLEKEKMDALVEAMLRSPSSRRLNPWHFVLVDDRELLEKLSKSKPHGSSFLKSAALGVVVCGDSETSDTWIEDTAIASIFIQLAAESLDLGSCWVQIRNRVHSETKSAEKYVAELLEIPEDLKVESIIAIGYPKKKNAPHALEGLEFEKVSSNIYGRKPQ